MINEIIRFKKIADTGSITKASESLWITQPALSQSLKRLEKELGYDLIGQTGKKIFLTKKGKVFYDISSRIIDWWEKAKSLNISLEFPPTYSIGLFDSAALLLSPFLQEKIKQTKIEISIDRSENLLRRLKYNLLDLCICVVPMDQSVFANLKIIKTWHEQLIPVTKTIWKGPVNKIPFIMHTRDSITQKYIDQEFLNAAIKPNIIIESVNPMFTKDLALQDYGVAFLPKSMIKDEIREKRLFVQKLPMRFTRTCGVFKLNESHSNEKESFIEEIVKHF